MPRTSSLTPIATLGQPDRRLGDDEQFRQTLDRLRGMHEHLGAELANAGEKLRRWDQATRHQRSNAEPLLLTAEQVAEKLGVCRGTVFKLIKSGDLRSIKLGRARRVPVEALYELIAAGENRQGATQESGA